MDPGDAAPVLDYLQREQLVLDADPRHASSPRSRRRCHGPAAEPRRSRCSGPRARRYPGARGRSHKATTCRCREGAGVRRARHPRPYRRPHRLPRRNRWTARGVLRRHAVRWRLRPPVRGHAGADVGFAVEAGSTCRARPTSIAPTNTRCANVRFALAVEPENAELAARDAREKNRRVRGQPTVPSSLAEELATNPFLRADLPHVRAVAAAHAGTPVDDAVTSFSILRDVEEHLLMCEAGLPPTIASSCALRRHDPRGCVALSARPAPSRLKLGALTSTGPKYRASRSIVRQSHIDYRLAKLWSADLAKLWFEAPLTPPEGAPSIARQRPVPPARPDHRIAFIPTAIADHPRRADRLRDTRSSSGSASRADRSTC